MRLDIIAWILACAGVMGACAGGEGMKTEPDKGNAPKPVEMAADAVVVATPNELTPNRGKRVSVSGKVERAKLGDLVSGQGITLLLQGERLADALVGTDVTVVGTLKVTDDYQSLVNARGEISQGTEPGSMTWYLAGWQLVH